MARGVGFRNFSQTKKGIYILDVWARKEWTDEHKDETDPTLLIRACKALGNVRISLALVLFSIQMLIIEVREKPCIPHGYRRYQAKARI
jgi:hypothetical protein